MVLNVTLPCLILTSEVHFTFDGVTLAVLAISFIANILLALAGRLAFSKRDKLEQGSAMASCSGYNTGNMAIPFAVPFFPGTGLSYVYMFDIGNALGWIGGAIGAGKSIAGGNGFSAKIILKMLLTTPSFLIYIPVLAFAALQISIPDPVIVVLEPIGRANSFLVMFMIGLLLDFSVTKKEMSDVGRILLVRFIGLVVLFLVVWFVLPLPELAKQMCVLCAASSMPTATTAFCQQMGDNSSVPPMATSISILIGIGFSSLALILFMA